MSDALKRLLNKLIDRMGDNRDVINGNAISAVAFVSELHHELAELKRRVTKLEKEAVKAEPEEN